MRLNPRNLETLAQASETGNTINKSLCDLTELNCVALLAFDDIPTRSEEKHLQTDMLVSSCNITTSFSFPVINRKSCY